MTDTIKKSRNDNMFDLNPTDIFKEIARLDFRIYSLRRNKNRLTKKLTSFPREKCWTCGQIVALGIIRELRSDICCEIKQAIKEIKEIEKLRQEKISYLTSQKRK